MRPWPSLDIYQEWKKTGVVHNLRAPIVNRRLDFCSESKGFIWNWRIQKIWQGHSFSQREKKMSCRHHVDLQMNLYHRRWFWDPYRQYSENSYIGCHWYWRAWIPTYFWLCRPSMDLFWPFPLEGMLWCSLLALAMLFNVKSFFLHTCGQISPKGCHPWALGVCCLGWNHGACGYRLRSTNISHSLFFR